MLCGAGEEYINTSSSSFLFPYKHYIFLLSKTSVGGAWRTECENENAIQEQDVFVQKKTTTEVMIRKY
jgi:hypothetical protein